MAGDDRFVDAGTDSFDEIVKKSDVLAVVDLWAEWCGPCRAITPKLAELKDEFGDQVKIVKVNVDENPQIAADHRVASIPTLLFYKGGDVVDSLVGNRPTDKIREKIDRHL